MERKLLGTVMIILGLAGMSIAGMNFINGNGSVENIINVIIFIIGGAILFFAGINFLVPQKQVQQPVVKTAVKDNNLKKGILKEL